jgi:hypothetical protein
MNEMGENVNEKFESFFLKGVVVSASVINCVV